MDVFANVQTLTNYEVCRFLQLRRNAQIAHRRIHGNPDLQTSMVSLTNIQVFNNITSLLLTSSSTNGGSNNIQRELVQQRLMEMKWIPKAVMRYLLSTPVAYQTKEGISEALKLITATMKPEDISSQLNLSKAQILSVSFKIKQCVV